MDNNIECYWDVKNTRTRIEGGISTVVMMFINLLSACSAGSPNFHIHT